MANKRGRPSIYSDELADFICDKLASSSLGVTKICRMYDHLPNPDTIYDWINKNPSFSEKYRKAKLKQADYMAHEIIEIADDATNDWMECNTDNGPGWKLNGEHVQRSRLRVDTRKWLASKLLPKQYGAYADNGKDDTNSLLEKLIDKIHE